MIRSSQRFDSFSHRILWLWFAVLALFDAVALGGELLLVPVQGESQVAELQSIRHDRLAFTMADSEQVELSTQELVRWGSLVNPRSLDQVLLVDGSILIGHLTAVPRDAFVLETDLWGELTLPRSQVVAVLWALPTDPVDQWKLRDRLWKGIGESETLTLRNGDTLNGQLIEGDVDVLKLLLSSGPMNVKREFVASWKRASSRVAVPKDATTNEVVLGLIDGTQLVTTALSVEQRLEAKLRCGLSLVSVPAVRALDEQLICYVRTNLDNVKYLAELESLGYKHVPFLTVDWDWAADRNVLGGPLSSSSRDYYAKGIGMHSTSRLAFELDECYDEFQAEVCLDATAGKRGSVVFRVFVVDTQGKWQEAFKSAVVRGGGKPIAVRVPLNAAKRIALVVEFADAGDVMDRANWLGARVVKTAPD